MAELIRQVGITGQTLHRRKKQYKGLGTDQVRQFKQSRKKMPAETAGGRADAKTKSCYRTCRAQRGSAFVACPRSRDLDLIFSLQFERTVNRDNTVCFQNLHLQIEPVHWRGTLATCNVTVHLHLDGAISLTHGPLRLARYNPQGVALTATQKRGRPRCGKVGIPPRTGDSHCDDGGWMKFNNQTFHLLPKADIFTCYEQRCCCPLERPWRPVLSLILFDCAAKPVRRIDHPSPPWLETYSLPFGLRFLEAKKQRKFPIVSAGCRQVNR